MYKEVRAGAQVVSAEGKDPRWVFQEQNIDI